MDKAKRKGRPQKKAHEKQTHRILITLTEEDYMRLHKDRNIAQYPTKSSYYRALVLDKEIKTVVVNENMVRLEEQMVESNEAINRIGVNVNQIAKHLNTFHNPAHKREILQLIKLFVAAEKQMEKLQDTLHEIHTKW